MAKPKLTREQMGRMTALQIAEYYGKSLGLTRMTTIHDVLNNHRAKHNVCLELERKYFPQTQIRTEEETAYFGA